jgi:hypothetical protein
VDAEQEPRVVAVASDELPASPTRGGGTTAVLDAIRALPDAVAARLEGRAPAATSGGPAEVTFVGEPPPAEATPDDTPGTSPVAATSLPVDPTEPRWRHPSRRRHRLEAPA